jgi:predicted glycosyltransferase
LLVPRTGPSQEQLVRAMTLAASGAVALLRPDEATPSRMATALTDLLTRAAPTVDLEVHDGARTAARILCDLADHTPASDADADLQVTLEAVGAGR